MRVLFLGNSHTYFNDMPQQFARMCQELGKGKPELCMLAYSGRSLAWHREEYFSMRFALLYGAYDFCVIQQQAHPFPDEEDTRRSFQRIAGMCRAVGTRPVIFMTWAEKGKPNEARRMIRFYRELESEYHALLAPIGELFSELSREHPEIDLYWKDGAHASPYGDYLIAACLASLLCDTCELSQLSDAGIDFQLDFAGEDGMPLALEEAASACVRLDARKTAILRRAVENRRQNIDDTD